MNEFLKYPEPINPALPYLPGRRIIRQQIYKAPLGKKVVKLITAHVTYDKDRMITTESVEHFVDPPLDDGLTPESVKEIRQCFRCRSIIHESSTFICRHCRKTHCIGCACRPCPGDKLKDNYSIGEDEFCVDCYEALTMTGIDKFMGWLFEV